MADENKSIRQKAVNAIMKIRHDKVKSKVERIDSGLRVFRVPTLNWNAKNYTQIIEWDISSFCEPVVTSKLSDEDLKKACFAPLQIPNYPSNSQCVERAVKLVSEASLQVFGYERRHELILSRQAARQERPAYETKRDFKRVIPSNSVN